MTNQSNLADSTLSACCAASLNANSDLVAAMLRDMPADKHEAIDQLLAGGGSVGIETLIDRDATNTISLVGQEREGARVVYATIRAGSAASQAQ